MMHLLNIKKILFSAILISTTTLLSFGGTTFTVNSLLDPGTGAGTTGSLRYCITTANVTVGATAIAPHVIQFVAGGVGSIPLASDLPSFVVPIFVDGSSAPGYAVWSPVVRLVGFSIFMNSAGASGSTFKGMVFSNGNPHTFNLSVASNITLDECFVGTDLTGTLDEGSANHGILANGVSGLTVKNSIVSGNNAHGLILLSCPNTTIIGCHIGLNKAGTAAIPNSAFGVFLLDACSNVKVGGLAGGATDSMNVISGNNQAGIGLGGSAKSNIRVVRNYLGLNKAGTAGIGNQFGLNDGGNVTGFFVKNNVVAANAAQGMYFLNTINLVIKGNYLGCDATGLVAIINGSNNIDLNETHGAIVGGAVAGEGNVIVSSSGPGQHGLILQGGARTNNCIIKGNYIGTDKTGTAKAGSGILGSGLVVKGSGNIIGGTLAGEANIISGNGQWGVLLTDGNSNQLIGNLIGVNISLASLGNGYGGVVVRNENPGPFPTLNNIVRNNTIAYNGFSYPVNPINATWIAPNLGPGIGIGVWETQASNTGAVQHKIVDNTVYCNAGLGISLNRLETTPGYGNINKATPFVNAGSTNTLTFGTAAAGDVVQVFANPSCGCQGEVLLGTVTADGAGAWSLPHANVDYAKVTTTGRDGVNNTSEFSTCVNPAPVTFISFIVYPKEQGVAGIEWQVGMELNNAYFTVEKSLDGKNFFSIAQVKGAGTSSQIKTYTSQDNDFNTNAYYRIKQTDFDGKYAYTQILFLSLEKFSALTVYPNPANESLNVSWTVPSNSKVTLSILNTLSQILFVEEIQTEGTFFEKQLNISHLPAGVYIIQVNTVAKSAALKVIKE